MNNSPELIKALYGQKTSNTPIWMMRQAGRYLPEYKATRAKAGSFLDLCYNPDLATEVTLQPLRRFDLDAAILFSDILVIPDALGRNVHFVEGEGPRMDPLSAYDVAHLRNDRLNTHLEPVYQAVAKIRSTLPREKALLGFCGAPWTVATYMIAGRGTPDQGPARCFDHLHPQAMADLIEQLVESSSQHLINQLQHGANAVQIFDSWSGVLDDDQFERLCVKPVKAIVEHIRKSGFTQPVIGFPKGAGHRYDYYRQNTGVTALGIDWSVPLPIVKKLQSHGCVQGNLDPLRLLSGGSALDSAVDRIMDALGEGPFIFNLGHGIVPQTPISHVEQMIARIRAKAGGMTDA